MGGLYCWAIGGLDGWTVILVLILLGIVGAFIGNAYHRRSEKIRHSTDHQYDYQPGAETTFGDRIAVLRMQPDVKVVCGQNVFAYDRSKGIMLIQTPRLPGGVPVREGELLVFELLCGVDVAAQGVRGGRRMPFTLQEGMEDCERLELQIETKNKEYPQIEMVLMPFRFESREARAAAMEAAREITAVLDEVIGRA